MSQTPRNGGITNLYVCFVYFCNHLNIILEKKELGSISRSQQRTELSIVPIFNEILLSYKGFIFGRNINQQNIDRIYAESGSILNKFRVCVIYKM